MLGLKSERPRVLYLTKVLPYKPAVAGDAVYSRGIIEAFSELVDLVVLCSDSGAAKRTADGIDWHVTGPQRVGRAGSVLTRWPLLAWKGATADYHAELNRLLKRVWDVVVVDNLGSAHALPKLEEYRCLHPEVRLVYVSHEHEYEVRRAKYGAYGLNPLARLASFLDLLKIRHAEERLLRNCDLVTVINDRDTEAFRRIAPFQRFLTLTPGYDGPVSPRRTIGPDTPRRVVLLGGRRPQQKRQILEDWLAVGYAPLTRAGIQIVIAGDMDDELRNKLKVDYSEAIIPGFVDDLAPLINSARVGVIADTMGGGFKLRLLSHVFQRLPMIGLRQAIDGLPTVEGRGYLAAPDLIRLSDLILSTIDDIDTLNTLQNNAFEDCLEVFSWKSGAEILYNSIFSE